jgi:hypothetical protein
MNNHHLTPTQICVRLLAAMVALAAGASAVIIAVLELKSILG